MNTKAAYWTELCDDDLITAKALLRSDRFLHMGFFCHMAVEKALKSIIAAKTDSIPPKIHDLPKLAKIASVYDELSDDQLHLMDKLKPLQIEARYPEYKERIALTLTADYCKQTLTETEAFLCWTRKLLEKLPPDMPTK